ncbi:MAG: tRNA pseudouridine(13) synthase TruD [Anaerolineae bacterium]
MTVVLPDIISSHIPGVGGLIRQYPEDFYVEEIPAYPASGSGQHTLFEIEKREIDTLNAIRLIACELGISSRLIGSAGLKDAHAVTRQHLSVEGIDPDRICALQLPQVRVLWAARHRNRLKIGHLHGNKFIIRIRQVVEDALPHAENTLAYLESRGLPNGFGAQRFGSRGTTHLLGQALIRKDLDQFFSTYLGRPQAADSADMSLARGFYDQGDYSRALECWPLMNSDEYRALRALVHGSVTDAYYSLSREFIRLTFAAYQSYMFNQLLQERLTAIDRLETGDIAYKHVNGACFTVEDAGLEQPRADRLEISATAPLYGHKVRLAGGLPGEREKALLAREGLSLDDLKPHGFSLEGDRRPLRVPLADIRVQQDGPDLVVSFTLPPGAFATNLLRELLKVDLA